MDGVTLERSGPRERQKQGTRTRIVAAATGLFAARGFEGTALLAISEACGDRVSLIVYHFGSKEGLWRACVDTIYAAVARHLDAAAPAIAEAEGMARLALAVRAHITAAAANPAYHRILFQEAMGDSDRLRWLVDTHERPLGTRKLALIREAQEIGLLPAELDPMHLKFLVSGLFALPIALAPEYRLLAGEDPLSNQFIDRHVAACLRLLSKGAGDA